MSKHTPTPWCYQDEADAYTHIIRAEGNRYLGSFRQSSEPVAKADAVRAVTCVNAFHDPSRTIPTEQITEGLFWRMYDGLEMASGTFDAIRHRYDTDEAMAQSMKAQIDTLLASFKTEEPSQ